MPVAVDAREKVTDLAIDDESKLPVRVKLDVEAAVSKQGGEPAAADRLVVEETSGGAGGAAPVFVGNRIRGLQQQEQGQGDRVCHR